MRNYAPNNVLGYTADAGVWCVDCACDEYGTIHAEVQEVSIVDGTMDSEGNEVHPIYEWDDTEGLERCMECGEWLIDPDPMTEVYEAEWREYMENEFQRDLEEAGLYDAARTEHLWNGE